MPDDKVELIPVDPDNPYPLGRAGVNHDLRNLNFLALVQPPPRATRPGQAWHSSTVFDQGDVPRCTAEAAIGMLRTHPFTAQFDGWPDYDDAQERQALYKEAQRFDPWPGESYAGSSVDAPMKVLAQRGHIASWRWLLGEAELREWVTWYGPAVVGTLWFSEMFTPDRDGYVVPKGTQAGGHAYRIIQFYERRQAYRIVNSWGRRWGQLGRAWIRAEHIASLLGADGEAVTVGVAVRD